MTRFPAVSAVILAFALRGSACAQTTSSSAPEPELKALLERLSRQATALQTALPNFECLETVVSSRFRKDKEKWRVSFTATLTVKPGSSDKSDEKFSVKTLEGKPFVGTNFKMPIYVSGGFDGALSTFASNKQPCFEYTLAARRIDFHGIPNPAPNLACGHTVGLAGFALLDADGEIIHIERTLPDDIAKEFHIAPSASVDFAAVELNGRIYRLSSRLMSIWPEDKDTDHFDAAYTGCHLFAATSRILPGTTIVNDAAPETTPK